MLVLDYFMCFFFKQKTAYEMRISDWSSYVCSSDLNGRTTDLDVIPEGSLMEVAVRGGVDGIVAQCGGACACGTCHVYIEMVGDRLVAPLGGLEAELLECVSDRRGRSRRARKGRRNSEPGGACAEVVAAQRYEE